MNIIAFKTIICVLSYIGLTDIPIGVYDIIINLLEIIINKKEQGFPCPMN